MRLNKKQKELVLALVAEGLKSDEINARAAKFKPPFEVSRAQVDFYRDSRGVVLDELKEASESDALRSGLALKEERVARLEKLANRIETDLLENDLLWIVRERALGSGGATKFVMVKELNTPQVTLYRALLDDIAKETNGRTYERRDSMPKDDEQPSEVTITVAYEDKKPLED